MNKTNQHQNNKNKNNTTGIGEKEEKRIFSNIIFSHFLNAFHTNEFTVPVQTSTVQ
jgi:hypothetical protein